MSNLSDGIPPQYRMSCTACGKRFRILEEQAGASVKCPHCESTIQLSHDLSAIGELVQTPARLQAIDAAPEQGSGRADAGWSVTRQDWNKLKAVLRFWPYATLVIAGLVVGGMVVGLAIQAPTGKKPDDGHSPPPAIAEQMDRLGTIEKSCGELASTASAIAERIAALEVRVEQLAAEVLRGTGEATAWSALHLDMTEDRVEILLGAPSRHDRLSLSPRLRYIARDGDNAPEANGPTLHIMAYGNPPGRVGIVLLYGKPYPEHDYPARVICWIRSRE
jgi:DNA-directed RNA polymerase subunit RPC12/RpoP